MMPETEYMQPALVEASITLETSGKTTTSTKLGIVRVTEQHSEATPGPANVNEQSQTSQSDR